MHSKPEQHLSDLNNSDGSSHARLSRRSLLVAGTIASSTVATSLILPSTVLAQTFTGIPIQYIAALGDPQARFGSNAHEWGLWRKDPGPRGVDLDDYEKLEANNGVAPAQWSFDNQDWWLEEHGLIMEQPEFPLPAGFYLVTGDRDTIAVLTVHPKASDGTQNWELDNEASIYDVTHLQCRSGRYTPTSATNSCSPIQAQKSDFPVRLGADMPEVEGCNRQDYAVFIVTAFADLLA